MRHLALIVGFAGCSTPAVTTTPVTRDDRLRVSEPVLYHVDKSGRRMRVADGGTLHSEDLIAIELAVSQRAYVYVLQRHDNGSIDVIMPSPEEGLLALEPDTLTVLPTASQSYDLGLDDVTGDDTLYVVVSRQPLQIDLDDAIEVGAEAPPKPIETPAVVAVAPEPAPPPPPVAQPKPATKRPRPLVVARPGAPHKSLMAHATGMRMKGVERKVKHKVAFDIEAPDSDDVIVRAIHFRHE